MNLRRLQLHFQSALTTGDNTKLLDEIIAQDTADKQQRINLYHHNSRGSLIGSLEQIYPVCKRILGETIFLRLAGGYILLNPSRSADLNFYGEKFPQFANQICAEHEDLASFPFLSELAYLEWCYHTAYYAADDKVFNHSDFSAIPSTHYNQIAFTLSYALHLLQMHYPVHKIWENNAPKANVEQRNRQIYYLCVARNGLYPVIETINHDQWRLISAIAQKETLAKLATCFPNLDSMLVDLINKRWICEFDVCCNS